MGGRRRPEQEEEEEEEEEWKTMTRMVTFPANDY
jgi:hypothetical protein